MSLYKPCSHVFTLYRLHFQYNIRIMRTQIDDVHTFI
ncbi:MAG TPA: hypothetical protein DEF41_05965 [Desulfovibrio sp.]|nr:hypothetical protein [Desulfovibrio sp.]